MLKAGIGYLPSKILPNCITRSCKHSGQRFRAFEYYILDLINLKIRIFKIALLNLSQFCFLSFDGSIYNADHLKTKNHKCNEV